MNSVDRIFIMLLFSLCILILSSGVDLLSFVSLFDFVVVAVLLSAFWVMAALSLDRVWVFVFGKKKENVSSGVVVGVQKPIDIVPIIREVQSCEDLRRFKSRTVEDDIDKM